MTHFICTGGCNGVSDFAGTCQAQDCAKHEHPLTECHCVDGKHEQEVKETPAAPIEQEPEEIL